MTHRPILTGRSRFLGTLGAVALVAAGCGGTADGESAPEPSPSTTTPAGGAGLLPSPSATSIDRCAGLTGEIEMQVLVGPSEAVGMDPVAVGRIPFTVAEESGVHRVQGGGPLLFENQVFEAEWGTYTVTFAADNDVTGTCRTDDAGPVLALRIVSDGEQLVSVRADGVQADYPWEGRRTLDVTLPAADEAAAGGEGWSVVLHID